MDGPMMVNINQKWSMGHCSRRNGPTDDKLNHELEDFCNHYILIAFYYTLEVRPKSSSLVSTGI